MDLAPSAVTRHLQALHEAAQVDMVIDSDDRRTALVSVTAAGREELQLIEETGARAVADVVASWSKDDLVTLARLLRRLHTDWSDRGQGARTRHARSGARHDRSPTQLRAGTDRFVQVVADWPDYDIAETTRLVNKLLESWSHPRPATPAGGRPGTSSRRRPRKK